MTPIASTQARPRIVIIGAGFGGLSAAKQLVRAPFDVTVVDRHNYHLFQPLLYQVATAGLSPADIASPIRGILRRQKNAHVILAKVSGVDTVRKEVVAEGRRIPFDYLIVATGAEHAYFGHDWSSYAPGLKTIDDATYLRRRILLAFERAESEPDADERRRLLNFVVVGGGPTGVEMAGAIAELAKRALASDFLSIDPRCARIILVEAGPRLLAPFAPSLSEAARRSLEQLGVEVRLGAVVTDCDCTTRPRAHRNAHHHVGRGRQGVAVGVSAWLLWSLAHIYFLIGSRNRLAVAMNWCWNYVTFQRGTRLITGISGSRIEDVLPAVMTAPATAAELGPSIGGQLASDPTFP